MSSLQTEFLSHPSSSAVTLSVDRRLVSVFQEFAEFTRAAFSKKHIGRFHGCSSDYGFGMMPLGTGGRQAEVARLPSV